MIVLKGPKGLLGALIFMLCMMLGQAIEQPHIGNMIADDFSFARVPSPAESRCQLEHASPQHIVRSTPYEADGSNAQQVPKFKEALYVSKVAGRSRSRLYIGQSGQSFWHDCDMVIKDDLSTRSVSLDEVSGTIRDDKMQAVCLLALRQVCVSVTKGDLHTCYHFDYGGRSLSEPKGHKASVIATPPYARVSLWDLFKELVSQFRSTHSTCSTWR